MNKPTTWRIARAVSLTFLLAATATATVAQEAPPATQLDAGTPAGDPPGRVARLNYFDGSVTLEPAGATDWAYAELNRPMTTGDQLWVDNGARSELHIGSTALRLGSQTAVSIVNLDDTSAQLKVAQGTLETRLRELPAGQSFEIDTPNVALQANGPGIYRVDAAPDGSTTTVTVRDGTLTAYGDNGSVQLGAGQQVTFSGSNLQETGAGSAPALDAFDQWGYSRDRVEDGSVSARYVSRDVPGYQDLDANGTWEQSPDYGEVWVPRVAVGWAPYHQGHWAWVAPWGWTWVDDAPWGFAPFHYGRWAYYHDNWAWVPGPVVQTAPPCYSPALVAFVGGGNGGWNVSLTVGAVATAGVAWLALGPGEPWHPAYHTSPGYFNRVNYVNVNRTTIINNNTTINNINYMNRRVPGAVMGMPANQFVQGQSTRRFGQQMPAAQLQRASFGAGAPSIAPVRQSFNGALRPANNRPPQAVAERQVIATRTPPTPFAYHDTLAQNFARSGGTVPGAGQPVVRTAPPANFARNTVNETQRPGAPAQAEGARAGGQPNFRVVQEVHHAPEGVQPGRPAAEPQRPGQPNEAANAVHGPQPQAQQAQQAQRAEQGAAPQNNGVPRPPSAMQQQEGRPGQPGGAAGNAQQEQQQRAQQEQQQRGQQEQQQRAQQEQQQRGQQEQQQRAQQEQQQRGQQEQQQRAQQEQQQRAQQEQQQRAQQEQQQRAQQEQQQRAQQEQQQRAQQEQQQRAQQEQQQHAQQEQQQRAQQEQQQRAQQQQQRAQQEQQQRAQQMQQTQQRQQQQQLQQREQPHPQTQPQQQHEQKRNDQQSNSGHRDEHHDHG